METIQIVLDKRLLHAADQAARRTKRNRSALVRDALREHQRRFEDRDNEERDREVYLMQPHATAEPVVWVTEAAWPAEQPAETSDSTNLVRQTREGPSLC